MTGFELNGTAYYYVRNLLGDVTKIITSSGTVVATYTYDAWGKCTIGTNTNNIANINPIRYRGYYYDSESSLYYLNSRYYDPEVGRFLSADVLAENGNLFAYCQNDPINRIDPNGYFALTITFVAWATISAVASLLTIVYVENETHFISNTVKNMTEAVSNELEHMTTGNATRTKEPSLPVIKTLSNIPIFVQNGTNKTILPENSNIIYSKNKAPALPQGIKGQGLEKGNKARGKSDWEQRNGPRQPRSRKKHTPGRDHKKKFKVIIPFDIDFYDED